jgi:beta-lactamase regulating signal transducer with metallopeptidase domain/WD40 repeat protein/HEAT repeat protein
MNEFVERLGWVLVHSVWQFALIALLAGMTVWAMRRSAASRRYAALVVAMTVSAAAPVATWFLQPGDVHENLARRAEGADLSSIGPRELGTGLEQVLEIDPALNRPADAGPLALVEGPADESPASNASAGLPRSLSRPESAVSVAVWLEQAAAIVRPWLSWIVAGWSLGVLMCSFRPLLSWHTLWRLKRVGISRVADDVLALLNRLSSQLGLDRQVRVLQSTLAQVPIVVGYFQPVILLPISLVTNIPTAHLEAILAHELAHIRRHDFIVNLLQALVETVFFYHPAVWWLSRRVRVEREHCCDDLVVALLGNRVEYGRALVAAEELRGRSPVLALGVRDGSLLVRIRRIVRDGPEQAPTRLRDRWPAVCLACGCAILAMTALWFEMGSVAAQAQPNPETEIEKLLDQLASAELQSLDVITGGGIFHQANSAPPALHVTLWGRQHADATKFDSRVQRLIELGSQVAQAVNRRLAKADPKSPLAAHLAAALRATGNADSVPVLIDLLKRGAKQDPPRNTATIGRVFGVNAELAATAALWTLTDRQQQFTPQQWEKWWDGVKPDFVVAGDRQRPEVMGRVTAERVQQLVPELAQQEEFSRERLIVLGPAAVPHLVSVLQAELKQRPADARLEPNASRPMAQRLAWVIDELGATDKIPTELRREYFTRRFAELGAYVGSFPIEELAACRALSHCSFADFCRICLSADGQTDGQQGLRLRGWMHLNAHVFSRRFANRPGFVAGDPSQMPLWNQVTPAADPAAEITEAVPVIVTALSDKAPLVRSCAAKLADVIGLTSGERPEPLIVALRDAWLTEADANLRLDIGLAMTRFSTPLVLQALSEGLRSDRLEIVSDAAGLIDWVRIEFNDQTRADFELLVDLTRHEDDQLRRRAARTLSSKAPQLLEPELERLADDPNQEIRQIVTLALRSNPDPEFADVLFKLAADSNEQVRIDALSSIGHLKDPASMSRLVPFLRDKKVHGYAVSALADMGMKDALPLLMAELKSGNDVGGMIYQHLRRWSGETFEEKPEPWLAWWDEKNEKAIPSSQGSILSIDPERKVVVISLGSNDGMRPRMILHVREPGPARKSKPPAAVKGKIEVTQIISQNTAEARILEERLNNRFVKGDRVVPSDLAANDQTKADHGPIHVNLKLKQQEFLLGESIAVEYEMTNQGDVDAPIAKGGFYSDLRINDGFRMSAVQVDENGKPIARPVANWPMPQNQGGPVGGFQLKPGEKYSTTLFVTRYLRFVEPGRYRLRAENVDRLEPSTVYSTGETFLTLKQPTPDEARGVFERMKKAPRQAYDDNAMKFLPDAADFEAMHQPVYLSVLTRYAFEYDLDALSALERMESAEANVVLVGAMTIALARDDWRTARTCFQHVKACLPFPNWFNEPLNDYDKANRDRTARTWRTDFGPVLTRLAKRLNLEVAARMRERGAEPRDADAQDPEFLKVLQRGFFPPEHPQSLLVDIDYIYRCIGRPEDFADCLAAFAHSIELTKTLPLETHQYFRPRGSAYGFRHTVMYMLQRGAKVSVKPTHPGEAAAFAIAVRMQPGFRPEGWQAELMKWLKRDSPYLAELILDYYPEPIPNEVLDYLPTALADDYIDLNIAACHVAQKHPRPAFREPLQKILDTAKDQYLRKYAVDAARANGMKAKYDPNAPFVDPAAEELEPAPKADAPADKPEPKAATAPPKGLEFLQPYPNLHGLSLSMTEAQFRALAAKGKLTLQMAPREGDDSRYAIPTGDGHTVVVTFKSGKCSGIQRIRGEERADKVSFESVSVKYKAAPLGRRQPEQIEIKANGSCVYHIDEQPARGKIEKRPEARLMSQIGAPRMLELERLLAKTDWLTAEGGEGPARHTDAGEVTITVVRNKQFKTITCLGMRPEPYNSLLWLLRGIAEQEYLVYVIDWLHGSDAERNLALIQLRSEVEALSGKPGRGWPYLELDYNRFLPTFRRMVRNPSLVENEVLAAIKLVTFVRADSELEWIARLKHDREMNVRNTVAEALADFGGEQVVPILVEMAPTTEEARWGLVRLGQIAVPSLVKLIEPGIIGQDFTSEHLVRTFLDHQKDLAGPIDERIIAAARQALAKTTEREERTVYFKEFLKLAEQRGTSARGASVPKTVGQASPTYVLPDHLNVMAIGFERDGRNLVTVGIENDVRIRKWDTTAKKLVGEVRLATDKHANSFLSGRRLTLSDDCQRVIGALDGEVGIWNAATGAVIRTLTLPAELRLGSLGGLACTPDLTLIACGSTPGQSGFGPPDAHAVVWDASTSSVVRTVTHTNAVQVHCVALSPDGKRLATGGQQAGTCVWDVGTGELLLDLSNSNPGRRHPDETVSEEGANQVLCLRFSPDGKWLAIGDVLGVKLVNWQTGQLKHQFDAPFRFGWSGLVFSRDGQMLARTATDKVVPIWSTETGKLLAELSTEAHDGSFSPDGNLFAAAFTDFKQAVAVWRLRGDEAKGDPSGSTLTAKSVDHSGEIVGRLVDEKGNPVAGATIACGAVINDSGQGGGANTVSDADGRYRLVPPSPGIYNVWLKKYDGDRRMTAMADDGLLVEAGQVATSQMRLIIGQKVAGRLVDVDGTPAGGRGIAGSSTARPESGATIESVKTKDDGSFEFFLPPGRAHLYVNDQGIGESIGASATIDVTPYRDVPLVMLTLNASESKFGSDEWLKRSTKGTRIVRHGNSKDVTGIVVDAANKPIAGATVIRVDGPIATANEKGEFVVEIAKGTQFIMYGFQPGYHVWFGTPTSGDDLKIVLEKKEAR